MNLLDYLEEKKAMVDKALEAYLPDTEGLADELMRAMKYSLLAGGKRLRPILCMAGAEAVGGKALKVIPIACALELIHTYSLIHDDLPVMDDDDLRRGRLTNHKVFGEAVALLAGDALLTEAFHLMTADELIERISPPIILKVINVIAWSSGYQGMVGGQVVDILSEGKTVTFPIVEFIHSHKTGKLITASVFSGALLGGGDDTQLESIASYGKKIGLAFQIADDILNIEGNAKTMGKQSGSDSQKKKITYPAVVGLNKAKEIQGELVNSAVESLRSFDHRADPLRQIARYIIERKK